MCWTMKQVLKLQPGHSEPKFLSCGFENSLKSIFQNSFMLRATLNRKYKEFLGASSAHVQPPPLPTPHPCGTVFTVDVPILWTCGHYFKATAFTRAPLWGLKQRACLEVQYHKNLQNAVSALQPCVLCLPLSLCLLVLTHLFTVPTILTYPGSYYWTHITICSLFILASSFNNNNLYLVSSTFTRLITHQISEFIHSFPESDLDYMPGLGLWLEVV